MKNSCLWRVASASVQGKSHAAKGLVCQDACMTSLLNDKYGIAVVADGAGSYSYSDVGARFVVDAISRQASELLTEFITINSRLPENSEWREQSISLFSNVSNQLSEHAASLNIPFKETGCTVILAVFSSDCVLIAHIGDGRAAYRRTSGEWLACMTPYKGSEASSTVFITLPIWNNPKEYIQTHVVKDSVNALVLMSDGCESATFDTIGLNNNFIKKLLLLADDRVPTHASVIRQTLGNKPIDIMLLSRQVLEICSELGISASEVIPGQKMMQDANLPDSQYLTYLVEKNFSSPDSTGKMLEEELLNGEAFFEEQDDKTIILCSLVEGM